MKLNTKQLDRVSEIYANLGVVFMTLMIAPAFTGESLSVTMTLVGSILSIGSFVASLVILRRK